MHDTVLIVAPQEDLHARAVAAVIENDLDVRAIVWDSATLPAEARVTFTLASDGDSAPEFRIDSDGEMVPLDRLRAIWWRRPASARLDAGVSDTDTRAFCVRESATFLRGAIDGLGVPIVNDPTAQAAAARKPLQLRWAQRVGLAIPRTLMTNDPSEVRAFWGRLGGRCIYKPFTAPSGRLAETRPLTEADLGYLDSLRHAPMIVQEEVEKGQDIRVNIFWESVFAASVATNIAEAGLDWRLDLTCTWTNHSLPQPIAQKLVELLRRLDLHYGCIDLRQTPDGCYVFLEVNPAGQFLFIEIDTGQPLTRTMAELLAEPQGGRGGLGHGRASPST